MTNEKIQSIILKTFQYEEETIFHVVNFLKINNISIEYKVVKQYLLQLLKEGYLKFYEQKCKIEDFENSAEEFDEDYWFVLTEKGTKRIHNN